MNTSTIKPGDIVRVDDGLLWFGVVTDTVKGGVHATYLPPKNAHARRVKARDITGHWRKTTATRKREEARIG
jgi:hypothetical protein